jgi:hypothetical protein
VLETVLGKECAWVWQKGRSLVAQLERGLGRCLESRKGTELDQQLELTLGFQSGVKKGMG